MGLIDWKKAPPEKSPGFCPGGRRYLVGGIVKEWTGPAFEVVSSVYQPSAAGLERQKLGDCALLDESTALQALSAAEKAYDKGRGFWPTSPIETRIAALHHFLVRMKALRLEIARLIVWEIGKAWDDAVTEVDRTVEYGEQTIDALRSLDRESFALLRDGGYMARVRRSPFGVTLCMGPYNYPLNETFATLLPALIMGNPAVVKLPRLGMLCTLPLLEAFAESFPPGVVNVISGEGAAVVTPIIKSGKIDLLAFIGSAKTATVLKHLHPKANRLRCVLGLGAKNIGIVMEDADLDLAAREGVGGALTFNGQRCTALKLFFVHRKIADVFVEKLSAEMAKLKTGLPFESDVQLTPLPDPIMVDKMTRYVSDGISKGARVVNPQGGTSDRTYFHPALVYPVTSSMALWREEQFGPVVPVAVYDDVNEVIDYLAESDHGQQASVFGRSPSIMGPLVDALVNQVCRVNLNTRCRRGPDTFPFSGRKDSAEGTLSVHDALRVFSLRTLVALKDTPASDELMEELGAPGISRFLGSWQK